MLPPLIDHHVHLEMIVPTAPAARGIAGVVDLGANPAVIARLAREIGSPHVVYAGAFLTATGGYPSDRDWLREGSLREIPPVPGGAKGEADAGSADAGGDDLPRRGLPSPAEAAVAEQAAFGASLVKVVLNADAGPVLDAPTLAAIVAAARAHGLPVVAHTEGPGMAARAIEAAVAAIVHTPWTEELPDALVARAAEAGQRWVSTLDIHGRGHETPELATAIGNLARFHAAGGAVLYGTDLGNGELPDGVNERELADLLAAGLDAPGILTALTDPWPAPKRRREVATFVPGAPPAAPEDLPAWLGRAEVVPAEALEPEGDLDLGILSPTRSPRTEPS